MCVVQGSAFLPQRCLDADNSLAQREGRAKSGKGSPQPVCPFTASDTDACQNRRGTVGSGTSAVVPSLLSGDPGATSIPLGEEVTLPLGASAHQAERGRRAWDEWDLV